MRPRAASSVAKGRAAQRRGAAAEQAVADYLWAKGFSILGMNVRVGRRELDIIARQGDLVVVVEVRNRGIGAWQSGFASIDAAKARRVREAGERLWAERYASDASVDRMRFDAATVSFEPDGGTIIDYVEGVL